jgi:hypothetical protein
MDGVCGRHASRRKTMVLHCYSITSLVHRSGGSDAESLLFLIPFMSSAISFVSVMSLM